MESQYGIAPVLTTPSDVQLKRKESSHALPLGGFRVLSTTSDQLIALLEQRRRKLRKTALVFANTNFVVQCRSARTKLNRSSVIIANDGLGMDLAARVIHGRKFAANLNGTDFVPELFNSAARPLRLFLVGGEPGVAQAAGVAFEQRYGQRLVGSADGFEELRANVVKRINDAEADVVLVALGNPRQEEWILQHQNELDAPLLVGVGALFDFMAGRRSRAPVWMRRLRSEWLYRLACEPKRLFRRYTIDQMVFFARCLRRGSSVHHTGGADQGNIEQFAIVNLASVHSDSGVRPTYGGIEPPVGE